MNVTWLDFVFCFVFVPSHVRCSCCSRVCLHFHVVQIKQIDYKINIKDVNNCKWKTFRDMFGQLHTEEHKATKKQIVRLQLNEKKSKESQIRLMSWHWKGKPTWRKDLITYNSHLSIMFSFNWLVIIWRGGWGFVWVWTSRSSGWKNFGRRSTRGVGSLENWTVFMDVIYASFL